MMEHEAVQIILIPGLMNDGWVWRRQIGPLSRFGPVTVANNDGCDTLGDMAARILTATEGPLAVAGHSMGGRVALEVAAQAPDRIARLALFDTGAEPAGEAEASGRLRLVELARTEGMEAVAREWLPPMLAPAHRGDVRLIAGITAMLARCTPGIFAGQQQALIDRPDHRPLLPTLACPALLATGSEDVWAPPAQHRAMAEAIPGGYLEIVDGSGHMLPLEAPDSLTALMLDWLRH